MSGQRLTGREEAAGCVLDFFREFLRKKILEA